MEDDRRRCIRLVTPDARAGVLSNGRPQFNVDILDESARGFGILVQTNHVFQPNDTWVLATENGYSQVRIAHVRDLPEGKRLGLERLRDIAGTAPKVQHSLKPVLMPITRSLLILAVIFGLSILGAILGPVLFNQHGARWRRLAPGLYIPPGSSKGDDTSHRADRGLDRRTNSSAKAKESSEPGVLDQLGAAAGSLLEATDDAAAKTAEHAETVGDAAAKAANKVTAFTQRRLHDWKADLEKLPWQPTQLLSLVSGDLLELELSDDQQQAIALVISRAIADLKAVAKQIGSGLDGTSISKRLESSAIQEIAAVFTPPQREKWNQMTAASGTG